MAVILLEPRVSRHFVFLLHHTTSSMLHSYPLSVQVIAAEGEQKASRALRDASEVIAESSAALQLRYLQVSKRPVSFHSSLEDEERSRLGFSLCLVKEKALYIVQASMRLGKKFLL